VDSETYRRLHVAFKALAEQSNSPEERARWTALALESSSLAEDPPLELRALNEEMQSASQHIGKILLTI